MSTLLNWIIFFPLIGAVVCLLAPTAQVARQLALLTSLVVLFFTGMVTYHYAASNQGQVAFVTALDWIPALNVEYRIGVDGLSLPLVVLTAALSVLVIFASWGIEKSVKAYMTLYLLLLAGMMGVFLALDLFLFYVFFEISLVPMYFLIGIWGGPRKEYAAIKFFLFTLAGSVCLLLTMLGLYFYTAQALGENTWDIIRLQNDPQIASLFAAGGEYQGFAHLAFWLTFIAFAIKIPTVPVHTWLPDAHVEAPTPISMILAGVLLKMGGYGLMRITYPIFPEAAGHFWLCVSTIGVVSILYGAFCALGQTDWKKLVAYSSVSHMGFVVLGLAVLNPIAWHGAYFQMIAHGITSAMMFFLVGVVYDRVHHRDMDRLGGLWLKAPGYGGWSLIGFFAAMGLPGLCGFVGEIMVLLGVFQASDQAMFIGSAGTATAASVTMAAWVLAGLTALSVIFTAGYILYMFQRVYMGPIRPQYEHFAPVTLREYSIMAVLGVAAIVLGIVPVLVFNLTIPTFQQILSLWISPA